VSDQGVSKRPLKMVRKSKLSRICASGSSLRRLLMTWLAKFEPRARIYAYKYDLTLWVVNQSMCFSMPTGPCPLEHFFANFSPPPALTLHSPHPFFTDVAGKAYAARSCLRSDSLITSGRLDCILICEYHQE
jgi:hypothetical protein